MSNTHSPPARRLRRLTGRARRYATWVAAQARAVASFLSRRFEAKPLRPLAFPEVMGDANPLLQILVALLILAAVIAVIVLVDPPTGGNP
jgi:hypothetical protein